MLHNKLIQDKLNSLEEKLNTIAKKDDVESLRKEFEDFRDDYLLSTNQKYLYKKINEYILKNYDKIKLKYTKNEDSYVSEEWVYKDDNISIIKYIYKSPTYFYCNSLTIDFTPKAYFNRGEEYSIEYSIEYKENILEDKCNSKEVFEKIQELKKDA